MPRLIADRPFLKLTSELGQVMAAAKAREQAGARVLHLERGEPDFETPPHVVEAIVNHVSGHLAGVAGVYNKAQYLTERQQALERWSKHVVALVDRPQNNVVPLRHAR